MPRRSQTGNVRKRCACVEWKTCAHPWFLDYQRDTQRVRENLDDLIGFHPRTYQDACDEARRAITAKLDGRDPAGLLPSDDPMLLRLLEAYLTEQKKSLDSQAHTIARTTVGGRPFGDWRVSTITADTLKQFQRSRPLVAGNRDLALLRAMFNWAVATNVITTGSPFRNGHVAIVKLQHEEPRSRRLQPGEYERLLGAARSHQDLIQAAIETGCRRGELLSLQWQQVRFTPRAELFLPAGKTKTKQDRRIPMSSVLRAILERRRLDPAGDVLPPDAYVFGDQIGRPVKSIKTGWKLICGRAGIRGLHFHDLRREAGSRWMDAGVPLATIQRWLGHANIAQTSTYLGASLGNDEADMRAFETAAGRLVTHRDVLSGSKGRKRTSNVGGMIEKTQQNFKIH